MEPEGKCKECLTYNGHQDGCSHATPPAAQGTWVDLTHEEKRQLFECVDYQGWLDYINAIEAKIRSKNEM
jgi:hypothetical protein